MKTCIACGRKIPEDAMYCYVCGAPVSLSEDDPEYMEWRAEKRREMYAKQKARRRHSVRVAVRSVIFVLILAAAAGYILMSPTIRTVRAVMSTSEADIVDESQKIKENAFEREFFSILAPLCADHIVSSFNKENVSASDAANELKLLALAGADEDQIALRTNELNVLISSRKAWRAARKYEAAGDYAEAMAGYASVVESDIHYEEASKAAASMASQYKDTILSSLGTPKTEEEYKRAILVLTQAVRLLPEETSLAEHLTTYKQAYSALKRNELIETVRDYDKKGYYYQIIQMVNKALRNNPDDEELQKFYITATNKYEDFVKAQVQIYEDNRDQAGAMELLERVRRELPDDAVVEQLYETVKAAKW